MTERPNKNKGRIMASDNTLSLLLGVGLGAAFAAWRQARLRQEVLRLPTSEGDGPSLESAKLAQEIQDLRHQLQWQYSGLIAEQERHYRQLEALHNLHGQLVFRAPLPPMRGWDISPDFAQLLITQIQTRRPESMVILGGGVAGLVAGYALQAAGLAESRLTVVEHDRLSVKPAQKLLAAHGLDAQAQVIHAPLMEINIGGQMWLWYDIQALSDLLNIDLLVVDGPPQHNSPRSMVRFPALPVLYSALRQEAVILLDDADRADEQQIVRMWLESYGVSKLREFATERGAVLLQRE